MNALRRAVRCWIRRPGAPIFSCVALALTMTVGSTVASVLSAIFDRPLAVSRPDTLYDIIGSGRNHRPLPLLLRTTDYEEVVRRLKGSAIESTVAAAPMPNAAVRGPAGDHPALGEIVTENYFAVLRPSALLGTPDSQQKAFAAISARTWQRVFNGDPGVLGRTMWVNGVPFVVTAVLAPEFRGIVFPAAYAPDFWVSLEHAGVIRRDMLVVLVKARSAPGVAPAAAVADLTRATKFLEERQVLGRETKVFARPGGLAALPPGIETWAGTAAVSIAIAAAALLVIACLNVAMVMLAAAFDGRMEEATRLALGRGRGRALLDSLAEPFLLAATAGSLALGLSSLTTEVIARQRPEVGLGMTVVVGAGIDGNVAACVAACIAIVTLGCAVLPAMRLANVDAARLLASGTYSVTRHRPRFGVEDAVLVVHLTASVVLVCLAIELVAGLARQRAEGLGFQPNGLAFTRVRQAGGRTPGDVVDHLVTAVRAHPEIEACAAARALPFEGDISCGTALLDGASHRACRIDVGEGYFAVLRTQVLLGVPPRTQPVGSGALPVSVSASAARALWPNGAALGATFLFEGRAMQLAAVVEDAELGGAADRHSPVVYAPLSPDAGGDLFVVARGRRTAADAVRGVQDAIRSLPAGVAATAPTSFAAHLDLGPLYPLRVAVAVGSVLAAVALCVSALGLYSTLAWATARRSREFAIRAAVGAAPRHLAMSAVGREVLLVAMALGVGLWLAGRLTHVLGVLVSQHFAADAVAVLTTTALVLVPTVLACLVPARRAWRASPAAVLRE